MEPLTQLAIMWAGVLLAGIIADKTRLTPALYFLAFGALMVNIGILPHESAPFIRGFAEVGIILIMFALGFEENTANFIRNIRRSWGIAFFGALAPFITAYWVAEYFWDSTNVSLMFGLTMTATAVSLTMVSLKSLGLHTSRAATGIMTSAILDDIASLALVAILVPIATGEATLGIAIIAMTGIKAIIFFGGIALAGAYLLPNDLSGWIARIPVIGRYGVRDLLAAGQGEHSTLTVMLIALLVGLLATEFGFHPAVGAYMAGLIFREEYFLRDQKTTRDSYKKTKTIVDNAAFSWIGPIFFVDLGTKILFDLELLNAIIPQVMILFTSLFVVQIGSAALAARYLGNYTFHESIIIGFGMLGRAELAFVVMDIAYIQNDIFSTEVFYTLMCTAFLLNTAVPLSLTLFKPSYDRAQREKSTSPTI